MKFHQSNASLLIPDSESLPTALARSTHLGIGAHQDDLEFMAFHGIAACYRSTERWFGGVTCTNGSGSARAGCFAHYTDAEMMEERRREQDEAARVGQYAFVAQLDYPSAMVKDPGESALEEDLIVILQATQPEVVYTHNPADKHATHIGVLVAAIRAIRALPEAERPRKVYGCEVWRDLDWLLDEDKAVLDVSAHPDLFKRLAGLFASQIAGGKRYDLAVEGRQRANATFFDSHATDAMEKAWFAIDLTPVTSSESVDLEDYTISYIERFREQVGGELRRRLGRS